MPAMADQLNAGRVDAAVLPMNIAGPLARRNGFAVHDDIVAQAVHEASGGTVDAAMTRCWSPGTTTPGGIQR